MYVAILIHFKVVSYTPLTSKAAGQAATVNAEQHMFVAIAAVFPWKKGVPDVQKTLLVRTHNGQPTPVREESAGRVVIE